MLGSKPQTIWVWQSAFDPKDYFWHYSLDAAKRLLLLRRNGRILEMRVAFSLTPSEIEDHVQYELFVRPIEEPEEDDDAAHEAEANAQEFPRS